MSITSPRLPVPRRTLRERLARGTVEWSPDLSRILALPRRPKPDLGQLAQEMTLKLKRPEGTQVLREHQAWVLYEAPIAGGLLGPLAVGAGKTLPGLLMAMVMPNCRRAILFIPPSLRAQLFGRDLAFYGKHWVLPNLADDNTFVAGRPVLHIVAYSELSSPKATMLMEQVRPDLVIGDEVHNLKSRQSVRTGRFLNYFAAHPETRFCGWSGTITSTSIRDYAHLSALALGEGSPLPINSGAVDEWAAALDPSDDGGHFNPGALLRLCEGAEEVRSGFRRRFVDTLGVVATGESELGTSIVFYERKVAVPEKVSEALRKLRRPPKEGGWKRPDGEELQEAVQVYECARQLASGFFYYWRFPRNEPRELKDLWFIRRQEWNRELRIRLTNPRPYLDSPLLCKNAAIRWYDGGCPGCDRGPEQQHERSCKRTEDHPLWASLSFPYWREIEKKVFHVQATEWLDDYLVKDIAAWAKEAPGLIWIEHRALGPKLLELGIPYYGGGDQAHQDILVEDGSRSIALAIDAHHLGKNMQMFARNLVVSFPANETMVEQALGRSHREGQTADEVEVHLYRHTPELRDAFEKAQERAEYVYRTQGTARKLAYGAYSF